MVVRVAAVLFVCFAAVQAQEVDECNVPIPVAGSLNLMNSVVELKNTLSYAGLDTVQKIRSEQKEGEACELRVVQMKNKWGNILGPSPEAAHAAIRSKANGFQQNSCAGFGLCADIFDAADADVWPLATFSYLIVPTNATDEEYGCDRMKLAYDYAKFMMLDSRVARITRDLGLSSIPLDIAEQAVETVLDEMRCRDADGVTRLVKDRPTRATALSGGGSSVQGEAQAHITRIFNAEQGVNIEYTRSSSGLGQASLLALELQFSGAEALLDMTDPEVKRRGLKMMPVFAAAMVLVYNLDGVDDLVLSREAVSGIYQGRITSWANPIITAENPGKPLVHDAIIRVVPEEKSGSTQTLARSIYSFDGYPSFPNQDYSLHSLQGSGLPDWPVPELPYADGAVCRTQRCIKSVCQPGERFDLSATSCVPCDEGYYSDTSGQHEACKPCPAGSYTSTKGNSRCAKCDEFRYQDEVGSQSCKACPAHTRRFFVDVKVGGAVVQEETPGRSVDECKCTANFWLPASVEDPAAGGEACLPCPNGATCDGYKGNQQHLPASKDNFWGDPRSPGTFVRCRPFACKADFQCEEGYRGRLCMEPEDGYFKLGEILHPKCPASRGAGAAMVVGIIVAEVWLWFQLRALSFSDIDTGWLALSALHGIYLVSQMPLRWHRSIEVLGAVLAIFNCDVSWLGWQCLFPAWGSLHNFLLQLLLPFILTGLATLSYAVRWHLEGRSSVSGGDKNVRAKIILRDPRYLPDSLLIFMQSRLVSFLLMMYHTLVMTCLSPFWCRVEPDGATRYIQRMPDVTCGSAEHGAMRVCATIYIMVVLIPFPLLFANRLWSSHKVDVLNLYDVMERYGFSYLKFHSHLPFWDIMLLARKGLLALVVVAVSVPMLQAVLGVLLFNAAMCLHLVARPMVRPAAAWLESVGLFCGMCMAVCGMIFFPSIDTAVECVGSFLLVSSIGEQCAANEVQKTRLAGLLLALVGILVLQALHLCGAELHGRRLVQSGARHIKELRSHQVQRCVTRGPGPAEVKVETAAEPSSLRSENSGEMSLETMRKLLLEETRGPITDDINCWNGTLQRLRLRPSFSQDASTDPYSLSLSHMLQGPALQRWEQRVLSGLNQGGASGWGRVRESARVHREELAYLEVDASLSKFATVLDHVSGFYVNDDFGSQVQRLSELLPLLLDFLAQAPAPLRADLENFLRAFTAHRQLSSSRAFSAVILPEFRAPVAHWLLRCHPIQRQSFHVVFAYIAAASGLPCLKPAAFQAEPYASPLRAAAQSPLSSVRDNGHAGDTAWFGELAKAGSDRPSSGTSSTEEGNEAEEDITEAPLKAGWAVNEHNLT